ncbi:MAG TPA: hypothetical protein DIC56_03915 [Rhizobium sp.]|nr:hypothetical protein [Rhizobium sp.]
MVEVTKEVLFEELLKLDARAAKTEAALEDLVKFMKDMNRELAEGQAKTEALKRELFKDRFDALGALIG